MKKIGTIYILGILLFLGLTQGSYAKFKIKKSSVAKTAVAAGSTSALANTDSKDNNLKIIYSDEELVNILQNSRNSVTIIDKGRIKVFTENGKFIVFNDDKKLTFYYGISGVKVSYKAINDFNSKKNYLKIYDDNGSSLAMQYDLMKKKGITINQIKEVASLFSVGIILVKKFIYENDVS